MKKKYTGGFGQTNPKEKIISPRCVLPVTALLSGISQEIDAFSAELGLWIMQAAMEEEIERWLERHRAQSHRMQQAVVWQLIRQVSARN